MSINRKFINSVAQGMLSCWHVQPRLILQCNKRQRLGQSFQQSDCRWKLYIGEHPARTWRNKTKTLILMACPRQQIDPTNLTCKKQIFIYKELKQHKREVAFQTTKTILQVQNMIHKLKITKVACISTSGRKAKWGIF